MELMKIFFIIHFGLITFVEGIDSSLQTRKVKVKNGCHTKLARTSNISCNDYWSLYPYKHKQVLDKECKFSFTPDSIEYFTYKVTKHKYRFVKLHFQFCNFSSPIRYTRCAIQPLKWVWTFAGFGGGQQYLNWPTEYQSLSMGMLTKYTSRPLLVNITVQGKCDIVIGQQNTTERMALAFAHLFHDLAMQKDQYNYSYWCFKTRIFIPSQFLYQLCKQVICPVETIGYKCCKQIFDVNTRNTTIICPGESFKFGNVWWICPFVIGVLLYLYFGLMLAAILSYVYKHLDATGADNVFMDLDIKRKTNSETTPLIQESDSSGIEWINHNPVTVLSIAVSPIRRCCLFHPIVTSRVIRCILAISSLTVVSLKVLIHFVYHRDFIIDSVKQGAPKDFLSMIAGYEASKQNFLIFLGGPYVALGTYIWCLLIFMSVPYDLSEFIQSGLPVNNTDSSSPLWMDLRLRERFGSRRILCANYKGYAKIYKTILANIFALLNPSFWGYIITLQLSRFQFFTARMKQSCLSYIFITFVALLYIAVCIIEILLVIASFGFPTIFGITMVYKAYIKNLYIWLRDKGSVGNCMLFLSVPCSIAMLTITVYMFSIIFVDSFIFISRIAIFTYTGLFVNPSYTAGWVIFGITVIMYMYDSIHSVNDTYEQLFVQTKKVCKRKGNKLRIYHHLYKKEVEGAGIPRDLYKYIVHSYKPVRVEVFVSVVKISVIIFCLYISLGILVSFDGFQELSIVTQTATTIFVSFVPKILKGMCTLNERRRILRMRANIDALLESYLIYRGINLEQDGIHDRSTTMYPTYNTI